MNEYEVSELLERANAIEVADLPDPRESPDAERLLASILVLDPTEPEHATGSDRRPASVVRALAAWSRNRQPLSRGVVPLVALFLVLAVAAVIAAAVSIGSSNPRPPAFDRPAGPGDVMPRGAADYLNLRPGETRKVGSWTDSEGVVRDLFVATSSGLPESKEGGPMTCLMFGGSGSTGGGCNPASDFFGGRSLVWTESSDDSDPSGKTHAFVVGVATPAVKTVEVLDSAGRTADLEVNRDGGFFYEDTPKLRSAGVKLVRLTAIDPEGTIVDRIEIR
jgi:hypothetical protein